MGKGTGVKFDFLSHVMCTINHSWPWHETLLYTEKKIIEDDNNKI
jgi:hypothetical protein